MSDGTSPTSSERFKFHDHYTRMREARPFHWVIWCRCGWEAQAPRGHRQALRIARWHKAQEAVKLDVLL